MKNQSMWNRNYVLVLLVNILTAFSFHILTPTIPKYAVYLGTALETAGFAATAFTITAILTRPVIGGMMNTVRKKRILALSLLIIAVSIIGYAFSKNLVMIILFRLIHGIGWGMTTTSNSTIVVMAVPEEKVGSAIGLFGIASSLASVFAPNLGLNLINSVGYFNMFLVAFSLAAAGCILTLLINEKSLRPVEKKAPPKSILDRLFAKEALIPAITILCVGLGMASISNFISLYADSIGVAGIGMYFTVAGAVMLVMRPLFGRLSDSKYSNVIVFIALFGFMSVFVVLGLARSLPMFLAAGALYGIFYGALCPIVQAWCVKSVDLSRSGIANSTYYTALDIGQGTGAAVAGVLSAKLSYSSMYFVMTLPVLFAIMLIIFTRSLKKAN